MFDKKKKTISELEQLDNIVLVLVPLPRNEQPSSGAIPEAH